MFSTQLLPGVWSDFFSAEVEARAQRAFVEYSLLRSDVKTLHILTFFSLDSNLFKQFRILEGKMLEFGFQASTP